MQTEQEQLAVDGLVFAQFSEERADAMLLCTSMTIEHQTLGQGVVETIAPRQGLSPLISVHFPNLKKTSKFNLDAFKKGMISVIGLPKALASEFRAWKSEVERLKAEREAADRVAREEEVQRCEVERIAAEAEARLAEEHRADMKTRVCPFRGDLVEIAPYATAMEYMEKLETGQIEHYRKALPPRIEWLKAWAIRISKGEPGLSLPTKL